MKTRSHLLHFLSLAVLTLAGAGLGGCSARRGEPIRGTFVAPDDRVQRGRVAYMQHCYKCHPGGEGGLGPGINDKPLPGFLIKLQSRVGLGVMPSIPEHHLSSDDLDCIVRYLKHMRHR